MTLLLFGFMLFAFGCGTLGEKSSRNATMSVNDTKNELHEAKVLIETTMQKLDVLANQKNGNLRLTYGAFVNKVDDLDNEKNVLNDHLTTMKTSGSTYFEVWKKELQSFSNEEIRERCEKRLETTKDKYEQSTIAVQAAVDAFDLL